MSRPKWSPPPYQRTQGRLQIEFVTLLVLAGAELGLGVANFVIYPPVAIVAWAAAACFIHVAGELWAIMDFWL